MEKKLLKKSNIAWSNYDSKVLKEVFELSDRYKDFISNAKTERE